MHDPSLPQMAGSGDGRPQLSPPTGVASSRWQVANRALYPGAPPYVMVTAGIDPTSLGRAGLPGDSQKVTGRAPLTIEAHTKAVKCAKPAASFTRAVLARQGRTGELDCWVAKRLGREPHWFLLNQGEPRAFGSTRSQ